MSTKILFPKDVDDIRHYAKHFLKSAKYLVAPDALETLVPSFKDDDRFRDRMVDQNVVDMPKLLTLDDAPSKDARRRLEDSADKLKSYWRKTVPPMHDEDIKHEIVGIAREGTSDCPQFCVVYRRDTNQGSLLLLQKNVRIDPSSGSILADAEDMTPFVLPAPRAVLPGAQVSSGTKTFVDATLTAATFIGFGIGGPVGIAVAGLAATVQVIFGSLMSSGQDALIGAINTVVKDEIQEQSIVDIAASFDAYSDWFKTYYDASWADEIDLPIPSDPKSSSNEAFKEFYKSLKNSVDDPNNPLLQNLARAMEPHGSDHDDVTFQVKAFQTFLYGATLHLNLLKVRILLDALPKYRLDSPFLPILVSRAKEYAEYGNKITDYIDGKIKDRLDKVSGVKPGVMTVCGGEGMCSTTTGLLFTDSGAELSGWTKYGNMSVGLPSDTVAFIPDDPSSCCKTGAQHPDKAKDKRDQYIAELTEQQKEKYFYTQDDEIKDIVDSFRAAQELYKQYINKH